MPRLLTGLTAGVLAGAAGSTALNAWSYLDQAATGTATNTSPSGPTPAAAAEQATDLDQDRAAALGPLGGLAVGVGVGALAGLVRGTSTTPPPVAAAVVTGLVAMAAGDGAALATHTARAGWSDPTNLLRDLLPHLAYGAVTTWALHRMVDPHTPSVGR